jgi:diadenylate cyclase
MLNWLSQVVSRMPAMTWWDVLDIAIVSLVIYEVLKAIRGTRAIQMAAGFALLLAMFYVSRWGHLQTVDWLIRNLLPYLRYFLTQEGADETIEEIAVAAAQLAAARTGAIVVIERQIGLRNYIEAGLPLDAMLTYDLLVSIFQPKSPLHDGAVIVQNDRVAAAACFLPLTVNPQLARSMGTRHRAAIGLTEENDAVAVIVSEETGRVSVALDGQIEGPYDPENLKRRLRALLK